MHFRFFLCCQFPWHCVRSVCRGRDGQSNCHKKRIIGSLSIFVCLAGLEHLFRGTWLVSQMWVHYINNNHPISYSSLVYDMMLQHAILYDTTIWNIYLNGKVNEDGFYHHYLTSRNTSTTHWCQVRKKCKVRYDRKVKIGIFWSKRLCNPFTQKLGLEAQFGRSNNKSYW